jgi:hypothetical protein
MLRTFDYQWRNGGRVYLVEHVVDVDVGPLGDTDCAGTLVGIESVSKP